MKMKESEFEALLSLVMCSDPWPLGDAEYNVIVNLLNNESKLRGYSDWIEALHNTKTSIFSNGEKS